MPEHDYNEIATWLGSDLSGVTAGAEVQAALTQAGFSTLATSAGLGVPVGPVVAAIGLAIIGIGAIFKAAKTSAAKADAVAAQFGEAERAWGRAFLHFWDKFSKHPDKIKPTLEDLRLVTEKRREKRKKKDNAGNRKKLADALSRSSAAVAAHATLLEHGSPVFGKPTSTPRSPPGQHTPGTPYAFDLEGRLPGGGSVRQPIDVVTEDAKDIAYANEAKGVSGLGLVPLIVLAFTLLMQ